MAPDPDVNPNPIAVLVQSSSALDNALRLILADTPVPDSARHHIAYALGIRSMECGRGLRLLMASENETTALAVLRPQFEAFARMTWVRFAATDDWVQRFSAEVPDDAVREPVSFPGSIVDLIDQIERAGAVDEATSLRAMKENAWEGMNSYTHGGLRAIDRVLLGTPEYLILEVIKVSNGLQWNVAIALAGACDAEHLGVPLYQAAVPFEGCFIRPLTPLADIPRNDIAQP